MKGQLYTLTSTISVKVRNSNKRRLCLTSQIESNTMLNENILIKYRLSGYVYKYIALCEFY